MFDVRNSGNILSRDIVEDSGTTPYLCASAENNAVSSYISYNERYLDKGNCIFIGGKTFVVTFQENDFYSNDSHNLLLSLKDEKHKTKFTQLFLVICIKRSLGHKYTWGDSISNKKIQKDTILLPVTTSGKIDFAFMEHFIAELEAERIAELEAYLLATGLNDYSLTAEEKAVLQAFRSNKNGEGYLVDYKSFNIMELFGKSTRGKRLKSADRVSGDLPFVTAGEVNEGISDFIGNQVTIFAQNTVTIDMFGSAKYRNYEYGGDDHIAVVHTEKLQENAAIFVTSAIHRSSHNGQFDYGHNFYAKDADELNILLPTKGTTPDYELMSTLISAVKKLVIKDVVGYADKKIAATKEVALKL